MVEYAKHAADLNQVFGRSYQYLASYCLFGTEIHVVWQQRGFAKDNLIWDTFSCHTFAAVQGKYSLG